MKTVDDDKERFARLDKLRDGKIDPEAIGIMRKIAKIREPVREVILPNVGLLETIKLMVQAPDVIEGLKNQVWAKVCAFDKDFLKELIRAMELLEENTAGICISTPILVCQGHNTFILHHDKPPTANELLAFIKRDNPGLPSMDVRTLRFICGAYNLVLSLDKQGRRPVNGKVKRRTTS